VDKRLDSPNRASRGGGERVRNTEQVPKHAHDWRFILGGTPVVRCACCELSPLSMDDVAKALDAYMLPCEFHVPKDDPEGYLRDARTEEAMARAEVERTLGTFRLPRVEVHKSYLELIRLTEDALTLREIGNQAFHDWRLARKVAEDLALLAGAKAGRVKVGV